MMTEKPTYDAGRLANDEYRSVDVRGLDGAALFNVQFWARAGRVKVQALRPRGAETVVDRRFPEYGEAFGFFNKQVLDYSAAARAMTSPEKTAADWTEKTGYALTRPRCCATCAWKYADEAVLAEAGWKTGLRCGNSALYQERGACVSDVRPKVDPLGACRAWKGEKA